MNKKVEALKLISIKINERIKVIETQLFSESNDIITEEEKKEERSIYKYNIG